MKDNLKEVFVEIRAYSKDTLLIQKQKLHNFIIFYSSKDDIESKILYLVCFNLFSIIEKGNYIQIHDFADAVHNISEIFDESKLTPQEFWDLYYIPYSKKYKHTFLDNYYDWFHKNSYPMLFSSESCIVTPIAACDFFSSHRYCIENMKYENKKLFFPDVRWKSLLLGAGEEKAVFAVCDQYNNIFALELIDEKHYLNGRLIEGNYFLSTTASQIRGIKFNPESIIGLEFTGLVKARDFIRGYEWGRFQFNELIPHNIYDSFLTFYMQAFFSSNYNKFKTYYKDVHERNVMFEITNIKNKGIPMKIKNKNNQLESVHICLRGIDLR